MEKFVVHQLIFPWTNVMVHQEFIVIRPVIRVLPHVHWHTPHLQTTSLHRKYAFTLQTQVRNMKSKVATFSGIHSLLVMEEEQYTQMETWLLIIPAFLRTQQLVFSIKDLPLTQSLSLTAQLTRLQIMDTWPQETH
jgi:hypothetical protein